METLSNNMELDNKSCKSIKQNTKSALKNDLDRNLLIERVPWYIVRK